MTDKLNSLEIPENWAEMTDDERDSWVTAALIALNSGAE